MPFVDYTGFDWMQRFPWEDVYRGLALAEKTVATFNVGEIQRYGLEHVDLDARPTDKRWYLALKHGYEIEGFNVNVTVPAGADTPWFRTGEAAAWMYGANAKHFRSLIGWINSTGLFSSVGRIVFFVTLPGQKSPPHVDYVHNDVERLPNGASPSEFLWITPPDNPKQLLVGDAVAPWACRFDPMIEHQTLPSTKTQWSLRIDGKYKKD